MSAEQDLATHIATVVTDNPTPPAGQLTGPVDLVFDENCRLGPMETEDDDDSIPGAVPDDYVVWVLESGGSRTQALKGGSKADPFNWPRIELTDCEILVWSQRDNYSGGKALADVVVKAVDINPPTGYFEVRVRDGKAIYTAQNDENHHQWSINAEMRRHFA